MVPRNFVYLDTSEYSIIIVCTVYVMKRHYIKTWISFQQNKTKNLTISHVCLEGWGFLIGCTHTLSNFLTLNGTWVGNIPLLQDLIVKKIGNFCPFLKHIIRFLLANFWEQLHGSTCPRELSHDIFSTYGKGNLVILEIYPFGYFLTIFDIFWAVRLGASLRT